MTPPKPAAVRGVAAAAARAWFTARGWKPFAFQREVWAAMVGGHSGLLHATTGSGKTYAVGLGALLRAAALKVPRHGEQAPRLGIKLQLG